MQNETVLSSKGFSGQGVNCEIFSRSMVWIAFGMGYRMKRQTSVLFILYSDGAKLESKLYSFELQSMLHLDSHALDW